ncbi:hypothetical protein BZG36_04259 [Bifiguratus adelaidae]|uniref:WWE domain-containing protein n=1 Tax=Bifiguratus adelaidae TaxID=1938954 RepID=A0A261XVX6_9FUNG|nr:hypothetical protein BZG36_04259 [Bifiguratus adelaidae]
MVPRTPGQRGSRYDRGAPMSGQGYNAGYEVGTASIEPSTSDFARHHPTEPQGRDIEHRLPVLYKAGPSLPPPPPSLTHQSTPVPHSLAYPRPPDYRSYGTDTSTSNTLRSVYPPPERQREVTWLFWKESQWYPFEHANHAKIEQAFTLGGVYVDIRDKSFPDLKYVRVFPTRFYLSYLGMKYRICSVLQGDSVS